jgi:hypothetical protein
MKSRSGRGQPKRNFQRVRQWTTAYSALGPSGTGCPQLPTYSLVPLAPRSLAAVRTHSTNPGAIWSLCGAKQSARFWRRNFGHPLPDSVAFVDERAARFVCRWLEIVGVLRANACLPLRKGGKGYHSRNSKRVPVMEELGANPGTRQLPQWQSHQSVNASETLFCSMK